MKCNMRQEEVDNGGKGFALNDDGLIAVGDIRTGEIMTINVPYTGLPPTDYMRVSN